MSRLLVNKPGNSLTSVEEFRLRLERVMGEEGAQEQGLAPEALASLLEFCTEQSCKKCIPCRIGLAKMCDTVLDVIEGCADEFDLEILKRTARTLYETCECEIGYESARIVLESIPAWDDIESEGGLR